MKPEIPILDAQDVKARIELDFGLKPISVSKIEEGFQSQVFLAHCPNGDAIVRINNFPLVFQNEVALYKLLEGQDVPLAKVLGHKDDYPAPGHAAIVLSRISGSPLNQMSVTSHETQELWNKAGRILRSIHETKLPGFGHLAMEADRLSGTHSTWAGYLRESSEAAPGVLAAAHIVGEDDVAAIEEAFYSLLTTQVDQGYLLHNVFHGVHVFSSGGEVSGVIDWGRALSGDPRFDLALSLFFLDETLHAAFISGYGSWHADDPIVMRYHLVIAAQKLAWRHELGLTEGKELALARLRRLIDQRPA